MKNLILRIWLLSLFILFLSATPSKQEFQGMAYYFSKSTMQLGAWGARLSEAQKKQIKERLKNRLEKTYVLTFNNKESIFKEDEKLDAISGATDSWGNNFSQGDQYKNVQSNSLAQNQEFYGKKFLVKDKLLDIKWVMNNESKQIGNYACFKASAFIPASQLNWYNFSWSELRNNEQSEDPDNQEETLTEVVAWYTPQIPISQGPSEFWGLPGLILEVSVGNTVMICSKIVINPKEKTKIEISDKGKVVTKKEYKEIITEKMVEMRDNRGRRRG